MRNKDGRYTLMFEEWVTEEPFIISPRISFEVRTRQQTAPIVVDVVAWQGPEEKLRYVELELHRWTSTHSGAQHAYMHGECRAVVCLLGREPGTDTSHHP